MGVQATGRVWGCRFELRFGKRISGHGHHRCAALMLLLECSDCVSRIRACRSDVVF
jgi:hypothetical protein